MAITTEHVEFAFVSRRPVDAIRADISSAYTALDRAEQQLAVATPDLNLLECELQIAARAIRSACRVVDTEISREEAGR